MYTVDVKCSNCGFDAPVEVTKGVLIIDVTCPKCGTLSLKPKLKSEYSDLVKRLLPLFEHYMEQIAASFSKPIDPTSLGWDLPDDTNMHNR